jgi:hypothetical protein
VLDPAEGWCLRRQIRRSGEFGRSVNCRTLGWRWLVLVAESRFDRLGEELEQQFEVGVALPDAQRVKTACHLAVREAEDGRAQQSLHLVGSFGGDASVGKREPDRVA